MSFPLAKLAAVQPSSQSSLSDKETVSSSAIPGLSLIPDCWRPEVEECFKMKSLTPDARDEITRTLGNVLFSKSRKPTRADCDDLARKLILKYPCTKDDLGSGYVSAYISINILANFLIWYSSY